METNRTGMVLSEFKDLLRKVLNQPGQLEAIAAGGIVPTGGIIMWSGSTVPTGWYLCDGTNGTPNLTDKFVLAGALGDIGTTATEQATVIAAHSDHTVTQPSNHATATSGGADLTQGSVALGGVTVVAASGHTHSVSMDAHSGTAVNAHSAHSVTTQYYPPYYTLAFIQKS